MKPLVLASYAQFGVGAGREARPVTVPAAVGRPPMAWRTRPCGRGDLLLCTGVLPLWSATCVRSRLRTCIAVLPGLRAVNAVCRVACLAWAGWMGEPTRHVPGQGRSAYFPETLFAKEDKRWFDCGGNHLGCPDGASGGLQCGLSGSRVSRRATP